jgi:PAS domain S-box-containing protein
MKPPSSRNPRVNIPVAVNIVGIYLVVGCLWIFFSDQFLSYLIPDSSDVVTQLQTVKGWFYVLATAGLLYWLINREARINRNTTITLKHALAELQTTLYEHNQTEAKLHEQEALLRLFAQSAPAGIAMFDREMRYVMASQRWADDYHLGSLEMLIGRSHYDVFPEIPERWRQIHQRCLAGATETCDADLFIRSDGIRQWIRWEIRPWYTAHNEIGGIIVFSEDITQRQQVEEELQSVYESLNLALSAADMGTWDLDLINDRAWRSLRHDQIFGYETLQPEWGHEIARRHALPEDKPKFDEGFETGLRTGELQFEARIRWPDQSIHWINVVGRVYYDEQHQPVRMAGIVMDITQRKQAEMALQQLNDELEQRVAVRTAELKTLSDRLIEAQAIAHIGSWEYDLTTGKIFWSDEIFRIFRLTPGQSEPSYESHLEQNFAPGDREQLHQAVMKALEQGEPYELDLQIRRADGSTGWILAKGKPILNAQNQVVRLVGVALDITERKAAEAQQQQLHQMKDDFLSTVSHELRSPLASIKMAVHLLEINLDQMQVTLESGTAAKPQRLQQYLSILREQCDQELELVNNLLDLQRLEAEGIPVEVAPIDINELTSQVASTFEARIQERQQHLQVRLPTLAPPLSSDINILTSVLRELLTNACKYTPPGETITVHVHPVERHMHLVVSNSGTYIPHEELSRIFDKFYRIPKGDPWKQGGTGLGLALAKKQIEYLKGDLWVESDASGVHFVVSLP